MKENIRDFPANCSSPFIKSCDGHCKGGGGGGCPMPTFYDGRAILQFLYRFNCMYLLIHVYTYVPVHVITLEKSKHAIVLRY